MEKSNNVPSGRHLAQVSEYWGLNGKCELLRYMTNHVFAAERVGERCVIRLSHAKTRQPEQLESEFAFMEAVAASGIFVMLPWKSKTGNRVESVSCQDGEIFHASVFPFAPGLPARGLDALTGPILREWGETLAKLHAMSESYRAPAGGPERSAWNEEAVLLSALSAASAETTD